jgi:hypothetical protein
MQISLEGKPLMNQPYKERFFNGVPSQNVCYAIKDVL